MMQNEVESNQDIKSFRTGKYMIIILSSLLFLFACWFLTLSTLAPVKALKEINNSYLVEDTIDLALMYNNPKADSLLKADALIQSKIIAADLDSINLMINLKDSMLNLMLMGVNIHQVKISIIKTSRLFSKMSRANMLAYLSTPFYITGYSTTIPKVPIVVKHAPRDTVEANKIKEVPQLPPEDYVHFTLDFDKHLRLFVNQVEPPAENYRAKAFKADLHKKFAFFYSTFYSGVHGKIPEYTPWIEIEIPRNEAKTIFRALPENAGMVLIF